MNKLVIDLEATCCNKNSFPREEMEIIEIGGCVITDTYEVIHSFSLIIKPILNPTLTDFCKKLTTITQEQVDNGISFKQVESFILNIINLYNITEYASWGFYDKNQLEKDQLLHKVKSGFENLKHTNVKIESAKKVGIKPCGIGKMLKHLNIEFKGTPHRGIDDAINITTIIKETNT